MALKRSLAELLFWVEKPVNGVMGRPGKGHKETEVHAEVSAASGQVKGTTLKYQGLELQLFSSDWVSDTLENHPIKVEPL